MTKTDGGITITQYIDKSVLVAEIEERIAEYKASRVESEYYDGLVFALEDFKHDFLDTLETKEVDLEKEYKEFINCDNGRSMFETAKHFFELGLKAKEK